MIKFQMEFNGVDFSEYLVVEEVRRPFLPSSDFLTEKVMGKRGVRFFRREETESVIEVDVRIIRNNRKSVQEIKRYLQRFLYTEKPEKLLLRDNTSIFNYGILGRTDLDIFLRTGSTTLEFICHDPTNYSSNVHEMSLKTGDNIIFYQGTYAVGPLVRISNASGSYIDVRLVNTGDYVRIIDNPLLTDVYEIDMENENVKKNGVQFMKQVYFESDFFELVPGENNIRLSSGSGTLSFREQGYDG